MVMAARSRWGGKPMDIKELDGLEDAIHWMHRAMIDGDRAETLRWICSVRFWANEIVERESAESRKAVAA